ncbi:adenylosuccinate lyase, partial [Candidatus Micrarchaeota archaeon]|nr:adenylosuccinate lyase [Candidatus Micrarchaeota archaeon]
MKEFSFDSFLSPFTWRYGSNEMRKIFSEIEFRKEWRRIWCALAKSQMKAGLVSEKELADLQKNKERIDLDKAHALEKEIRHDLMAEVMVFSEQSPVGGGKIHLGATSMDIEDNAEVMRSRKALKLIKARVVSVLNEFNKKILQNWNLGCIGFTH